MSTRVDLSVVEWNAEVDMAMMNRALDKDHYIAELYEEVSQLASFTGMFLHFESDKRTLIYDREDHRYRPRVEVWGCFGEETMKIMAPFVKSGKIVLQIDVEGDDPEYWIIEPNSVRRGKVTIS